MDKDTLDYIDMTTLTKDDLRCPYCKHELVGIKFHPITVHEGVMHGNMIGVCANCDRKICVYYKEKPSH